MQAIDYSTAAEHKLIRFMTPGQFMNQKDAFFLPDGESIRIDGKDFFSNIYPCSYIDAHHVSVGHSTYHINQFAEIMGNNGNHYEPLVPITDLSLYEKKFYDRELRDENKKLIPYHQIIVQQEPNNRYQSPALSIAVCPSAAHDRVVCIAKHENNTYSQEFMSLSDAPRAMIENGIDNHLSTWDRATLTAVFKNLTLSLEKKNSLDSMLTDAESRKQSGHKQQTAAEMER